MKDDLIRHGNIICRWHMTTDRRCEDDRHGTRTVVGGGGGGIGTL
jgi:hypothetical protein